MLKSKSPIAAVEADLVALTKRGAGLEQRRDAATTTLATATAERRRLLTETDDPTAADLAKADRAVRDATDARDAALDALAAVDGRVAEVRATIERLNADAERERQAVAIEASAREADAAIARIVKAAGEMESARRDLAAAILPVAIACYDPPSNAVDFGPSFLTRALYFNSHGEATFDTLDGEQVASRVAGHFVAAALPGLGIVRQEDANKRHMDGQPTRVLAPVDGNAARSLLTDPMRAAAARVREGAPAALVPGSKQPRRRADRWTTDAEGRSFDAAGVPVTPGGFYLDDEVAA
ncbi:hypothetical protein [Lichenibacterium ramalinae]|uniref:Uncharacterized protein n=1 Tax=Lichenibacterium ramalinae TaxID=2316527 RepID=A0A4Q2RE40_9HYPH|nr:hypothetical protein [Lichenibacterium ramalinae]RYB05722.1 hypothetical protein D3272_09060 [Lichenibacterium ramalinae]